MFSSAEKSKNVNVQRQQQAQQQNFFRKAGEGSFFGPKEQNSFFSQPVQAKLNVSSPDDPQEREADAVADRVMRMSEPAKAVPVKEEDKIQKKKDEEREEPVQAKLAAHEISVQRKCAACEKEEKISRKPDGGISRMADKEADDEEVVQAKNFSGYTTILRSERGPPVSSNTSFEQSLSSSKGGGSAMPAGTQQFMENRFGADFSGVRIHTGTNAENLSSSINAQAFAHGNDIYFNSGKFSPQTEAGGTLLAHELTHTIQQGASSKNISKKDSKINLNSSKQSVKLQRKATGELTEQIDLSAQSGGNQLNGEAMDYLQDYYNLNLSDIRIHSDFKIGSICSGKGVKAFTQGKNIAISPFHYNYETEGGAMLLSQQVSKSLQQRGISPTAKDGNAVGGLTELFNNIKNAAKEKTVAPRVEKEKESGAKNSKPEAREKKKGVEKSKGAAKAKKAGSKKKSAKGSKGSNGLSFKPVKLQKGRSPKTPAEDAAFLAVISKTKKTAKDQKQHEPAEKKAEDAQKNAGPVQNEAEGKAQNRKSDALGVASEQDKPFDAVTFKAELLKKIEEITPKNLEEAADFKSNNKIDQVKSTVNNKVEQGKQDTTGPVDSTVNKPLDVNDADNKKSVPLPPTAAGLKAAGPRAKNAVPKNKTAEEISMQEQSASLDAEMKSNNVTGSQLKTANEPSFEQALDEKNKAQKDAIEKPKQYKKEEAAELHLAKTEATGDASKALTVMHNNRTKNFNATVNQQKTAKTKDEETRAKVTTEIERLYKVAEQKVTTSLAEAETQSEEVFDKGSEAARQDFENYVDRRMREYKARRYSGIWGGLRWAKDKLFGMPDEVNAFYKEGRKLYLDKMDAVITNVAHIVTTKLNEAKDAIKSGKKSIDDFVVQLPKDQQSIGKEAAESIKDKFDSLEQNVNDKRDGLIDSLAKKYVDNVKKLDERIEALKEANKGLVDKAIGLLKAVWKVIKDLTNLFTTILAKLAAIIGTILDDPGKFFDNVGKAFKLGLSQFKNNFIGYLEKGLMDWLATNLGLKGIELPEKFDFKAIILLSLEVMGITKEHIRERAVAILGEKKVKMIETAGGVLYRVANEGIGAIWELILEKISDFKEMVWEAIKSFIQTKIIEAAITFVLSLLTPVGAFVKVCMAIYDFLMALVRFKDRIVELLDTVLKAVVNIAGGAIDDAANAIEKAFAKSIPVIIAFLAALLRLNDIAAKVRAIIMRIRARVDKAIDFVIKKAAALAGKAVTKGKDVAIAAGKKILSWLGLEKKFLAEDGEQHRLYFEGSEENPILMIQSNPVAFQKFIHDLDIDKEDKKREGAKQEALPKAKQIDEERMKRVEGTDKEKEAAYAEKGKKIGKLLNQLAKPCSLLFGSLDDVGEPDVDNPSNGDFGGKMSAVRLNKKQKRQGSGPTQSFNSTYAVLNKRRSTTSPDGHYYVKGHLLNQKLGGTGDWNNLTPLTISANKDHETNIESIVKAGFRMGAVIEYSVKPVYGNNSRNITIPNSDPDAELKREIVTAEKKVPTRLECEAHIMKKQGKAFVRGQKIVLNSAIVKNDIGNSLEDYASKNIETIYLSGTKEKLIKIPGVNGPLAEKIAAAYKDRIEVTAPGKNFSSYESLAEYEFSTIAGYKNFTDNQKSVIRSFKSAQFSYVKLF